MYRLEASYRYDQTCRLSHIGTHACFLLFTSQFCRSTWPRATSGRGLDIIEGLGRSYWALEITCYRLNSLGDLEKNHCIEPNHTRFVLALIENVVELFCFFIVDTAVISLSRNGCPSTRCRTFFHSGTILFSPIWHCWLKQRDKQSQAILLQGSFVSSGPRCVKVAAPNASSSRHLIKFPNCCHEDAREFNRITLTQAPNDSLWCGYTCL
jgi:hypothetical protein